jgi:hypothetical protein
MGRSADPKTDAADRINGTLHLRRDIDPRPWFASDDDRGDGDRGVRSVPRGAHPSAKPDTSSSPRRKP